MLRAAPRRFTLRPCAVASDIKLLIFDPRKGTMVCNRWMGMSAVRERARVLLGTPAVAAVGYECWAQVTAPTARLLADTHYAGGVTPADVDALAASFPPSECWWMVEHDF